MVSAYPSEVLPYGIQLLSLRPQSNQRLCLYPLSVLDHLCTCMTLDGHWSDNDTQAVWFCRARPWENRDLDSQQTGSRTPDARVGLSSWAVLVQRLAGHSVSLSWLWSLASNIAVGEPNVCLHHFVE